MDVRVTPLTEETFPTALDPLQCNRYEIRKFAKEAFKLSINYLGVCCGANPMLIREVAEAVGLTVPASRYRENMSNHFMYGTNKRIPKHMKAYRGQSLIVLDLSGDVIKNYG